MAGEMSAERELDDMTECSICTEVFTDPRVLPCIHTFCLKCLLNYGKDRQPGDTMPCPLCRKGFTMPADGLSGTQKNFFMEKLLNARKLSAERQAECVHCDVCCNAKAATMHCVQCQQNYCDQCSRIHTMMKGTADHLQKKIRKLLHREHQHNAPKQSLATCEVHKGKEIEVFCQECKMAICTMCFIKAHKNHAGSGIEEVSVDLRKQMTTDVAKATENVKNTEELLHRFEKEKKDLLKHLTDVESEVNQIADKLIEAIQRDRRKLLSEVESIRQKTAKQLETVKEELEHHMAALESFKRYSETLLSSGTACDVTRSAKSLHDRADELTKLSPDIIGHLRESSLPHVRPTVKFTPSTFVNEEAGNLVGDITFSEEISTVAAVTHVMPKGNWVSGVTSLGDDVFVLRFDSQRVEVYDAVTFTLRRHLAVPGLGPLPFSLAVCPVNKCLYVPDNGNNSVHRVELSGSNAVMKWPVAPKPVGLSVNSAQNALVVSQRERKLQEFTTRGSLVRNIQLQPDIGNLRHAVQLSADKFLVSHYGRKLHGICMVDDKGAVVSSYGGPRGSGLTKMNCPAGLAVDKKGNVLVADEDNNRLLVLDQSLNSAHEMNVSVDRGVQSPWSLHYDESRRRLYIGELSGCRVIVIDNLKDFSSSRV